MNIMILGAGGPIGGPLAKHLAFSGVHNVVNVSRRGGEMDRVTWVTGDRDNPHEISALIDAHAIDALIDVTGRTVAPGAALIKAIDGKLKRYVFISSGDVYRNHGLVHRRGEGAPDESPLTEDSPLRTELYLYRQTPPRATDDPNKWLDDYEKIPVEALVQNMETDWVICRLPMVYGGASPSCRRFDWIAGLMKSGESHAEIPAIWLDWKTSYGFLDNVVASIMTMLIHEDAPRQIFNIVDHEPMTHLGWLAGFSRVFDWHCDIIPTDSLDNPIGRLIQGLDLSVPLNISGAKQRDLLGIEPVFSLDDCIQRAS